MVDVGLDADADHLQREEIIAADRPRHIPIALLESLRRFSGEAHACAEAGDVRRCGDDVAVQDRVAGDLGESVAGRTGRPLEGVRNLLTRRLAIMRAHAVIALIDDRSACCAASEMELPNPVRRFELALCVGRHRGEGLHLDGAACAIRRRQHQFVARRADDRCPHRIRAVVVNDLDDAVDRQLRRACYLDDELRPRRLRQAEAQARGFDIEEGLRHRRIETGGWLEGDVGDAFVGVVLDRLQQAGEAEHFPAAEHGDIALRDLGLFRHDPWHVVGLREFLRGDVPPCRARRVQRRMRLDRFQRLEDQRRAAFRRRIFHGETARDLDDAAAGSDLERYGCGGGSRRRRLVVHHGGELAHIVPLRRGAQIAFVGIGIGVAEQHVRGAGEGAHDFPAIFAGRAAILVDEPAIAGCGILRFRRHGRQQIRPGDGVNGVGIALLRLRGERLGEQFAPFLRLAFFRIDAAQIQRQHSEPQLLEPHGRVAVDILEAPQASAVPARQVGAIAGPADGRCERHAASPALTVTRNVPSCGRARSLAQSTNSSSAIAMTPLAAWSG